MLNIAKKKKYKCPVEAGAKKTVIGGRVGLVGPVGLVGHIGVFMKRLAAPPQSMKRSLDRLHSFDFAKTTSTILAKRESFIAEQGDAASHWSKATMLHLARRSDLYEALLGLHAGGVSSAQKHEAALTRHEALGGIAAKHEAKP